MSFESFPPAVFVTGVAARFSSFKREKRGSYKEEKVRRFIVVGMLLKGNSHPLRTEPTPDEINESFAESPLRKMFHFVVCYILIHDAVRFRRR